MALPEIGQDAPDFELPSDGGGTIALSSLKGKAVVLYFYPKDDTSGCTTEAVDFSALKADFDKAGAVIVGLSPDSAKSHDKFKAKHGLSVILASDEEKSTLESYGVWVEKSMYGRKYMGIDRSTFLLDGEGKIAGVWRKVKVPGHAAAVLKAAQALNA